MVPKVYREKIIQKKERKIYVIHPCEDQLIKSRGQFMFYPLSDQQALINLCRFYGFSNKRKISKLLNFQEIFRTTKVTRKYVHFFAPPPKKNLTQGPLSSLIQAFNCISGSSSADGVCSVVMEMTQLSSQDLSMKLWLMITCGPTVNGGKTNFKLDSPRKTMRCD